MKYGNLCIAAHNYKNTKFFSNLSKLQNGDTIKIYDNSGISLEYEIYNIYKAKYTDISCTSQETNRFKTCYFDYLW